MRMVPRLALSLFLGVGLVVLPACERGGKEPTTPRRGGVLRLGVTPLGSLDPAQARTVEQLLVTDQLFDSLTAYDDDQEPVGAIAERWTSSADQRQWDFYLRKEARFTNGREITATDVKYSL